MNLVLKTVVDKNVHYILIFEQYTEFQLTISILIKKY